MGRKTKIDWCDSSWNPITGCLHGCPYCYAAGMARRFGGKIITEHDHLYILDAPIRREDGTINPYPYRFDPTYHKYRLKIPQDWKKPQTIFVCSMADMFGDWVPDEWIKHVFEACKAAPQHRFLLLTKNPARFGCINGWNHQYNNEYAKDNMWFGTTITRQCELNRIRELPYGNAHTFLSIEPILERIDLDRYIPTADTRWHCSYCGHYTYTYTNHCASCGRQGGYSGSFRKQPVNWIIVGAETGNRKNKVVPKKEWVMELVECARLTNTPIFMKESLRTIMGEDFCQEFPWSPI